MSLPVRGTVLHCGRFGCVVRLEDGRLALLPATDEGFNAARRAVVVGRRPDFSFSIVEQSGRHVRVRLEPDQNAAALNAARRAQLGDSAAERTSASKSNVAFERSSMEHSERSSASTSLEQKIIDYLRQTADWDPEGRAAERALASEPPRVDRLLPFELRARRQYRESPKRPRRPKRVK